MISTFSHPLQARELACTFSYPLSFLFLAMHICLLFLSLLFRFLVLSVSNEILFCGMRRCGNRPLPPLPLNHVFHLIVSQFSEVSICRSTEANACMGCADAAIGCSFRYPNMSTNSVRRLNERIGRGMRTCSNRLLPPMPQY